MRFLRPPAWFAILAFGTVVGSAADLSGIVFEDRNDNAAADPGEAGVPNALVSDGTAVVATDATGHYHLTAAIGSTIFVINPEGWRPPVNAEQLPQFHRKVTTEQNPDFPMVRADDPERFQVLLLTDPQPSSLTEIGYYDRTLLTPLSKEGGFSCSVTLGDIVYDRRELYTPLLSATRKIAAPAYYVCGNHDLDIGVADDRLATRSFEQSFGPATYAFRRGRALFVALNNVRTLGGPRYIGGLREDQFAFVANLLSVTPRDDLVVLMMHIPWFLPAPGSVETFRRADRARLFTLFENRPHVLWLSGHTHYQRHVFYGPAEGWNGAQPLHEYNVAAACGSYWSGPADATGVPISTMPDGTPHGFAVLTVAGTEVRTDYRAARHPADFQMELYAPTSMKPRSAWVSFYANVFNGHDGWKVESRVDEKAWNTMRRVLAWDPAYAKLFLDQNAVETPLATPRLPDPVISYHLWRGGLPPDLEIGLHRLEVRATDPAGRTFASTREVRVAAPPDGS